MAKKVGLNMVYSATNIIIEVECWNSMRRCFFKLNKHGQKHSRKSHKSAKILRFRPHYINKLQMWEIWRKVGSTKLIGNYVQKTCLGVFLLGNSLCSLGGDYPKENEAKIAIIPRKM